MADRMAEKDDDMLTSRGVFKRSIWVFNLFYLVPIVSALFLE